MIVSSRKNFCSVDIDEKPVMYMKEDQGEKLIQTLIFSKLPIAHEVFTRRHVLHIIELFLHQRA